MDISFNLCIHKSCLTRLIAPFVAWIALSTSAAFAQRDLTDIPDPDPELERQSFIVAEGFEVNLYAADPMLAKPIQMNFDDQGRLWVASSEVYPHIEPGQEANDKVLILNDTDGDGAADTTEVFADGLLIPTGIVPGDGGCYVANSTDLLFLGDSDGDGVADVRRPVLSGFGTEDTHHLLHTLRWGPDGCLYMNQSIYIHSHIETPHGVRHLNGGGIWRFRPETMELDILCRGFVNSWGHDIDDWGQSFATDGAYREGINYVFPGSVFVAAPDAKRILSGLNPGSPKHCGLEIVGGEHLPDDWQGNMLTNDFRANRVCRFVISENGSGYASRQEVELIKTRHVAFRPIDVKMGPDGAIYVADWYNPIIQHGEVDFRDPRRDHVHGRIWRVTAKDRTLVDRKNLAELELSQLVDLLGSTNSWERLHAKLRLKTFPTDRVEQQLQERLNSLDDGASATQQALEILWAYQSVRLPNPTLLNELLMSSNHRARAAAIRVAVDWRQELPDVESSILALVEDEHPRVRLEAVRAAATIASAESAVRAASTLERPMDRFLDFALWQTMRDLAPFWLPATNEGHSHFEGNIDHLIFALRAVDSNEIIPTLLQLSTRPTLSSAQMEQVLNLLAVHGDGEDLGMVLVRAFELIDQRPQVGAKLLLAIQANCLARGRVRPGTSLEPLLPLLEHEVLEVRIASARAIGTWRLDSGVEQIVQSYEAESNPQMKVEAINALAIYGTEGVKDPLRQVASSAESAIVRFAAIRALAPIDIALACQLAMSEISDLEDGRQLEYFVPSLLAQQGGVGQLNRALTNVSLSAETAKVLLRTTQRSNSSSEQLLESIRRAGNLENTSWELDEALVEKMMGLVAEQGDPVRGEEVYRRADLQCLTCHAIGGSGGVVGPDLVSIGASAPVDYLIESLIAPNAKIKENFHSKSLVTLDGKIVNGIPVSQSSGILTLRQADGSIIEVREDDIDEIVDGPSLMAEGLVDPLTETELVDLVRFLSELGKVGNYAIGNRSFVRNWESLIWTQEANRRLNRTSYDTAAGDDPTLNWKPEFSRVSGHLPIDPLSPFVIHQGYDPTSFVRFEFTVEQAGPIRLLFEDQRGIEVWIDEKPTPFESSVVVELERGTHHVMLAVNRELNADGVRVELQSDDRGEAQFLLK